MKMSEIVCIVCPNGCPLTITMEGEEVVVNGAKCKRGILFAKEEMTAPKRSVTTTVKTIFKKRPVLPVRTDGDIPKEKIEDLIDEMAQVVVDRVVSRGEVIAHHVVGTLIDVISTSDMRYWIEEGEE